MGSTAGGGAAGSAVRHPVPSGGGEPGPRATLTWGLSSRPGPVFLAAHVVTQRGQQESQRALDFTGALGTTLRDLLLQRAPSRCCVSFVYPARPRYHWPQKCPHRHLQEACPLIPFAAHGTSSTCSWALASCPCDGEAATFPLGLRREDAVLCTSEWLLSWLLESHRVSSQSSVMVVLVTTPAPCEDSHVPGRRGGSAARLQLQVRPTGPTPPLSRRHRPVPPPFLVERPAQPWSWSPARRLRGHVQSELSRRPRADWRGSVLSLCAGRGPRLNRVVLGQVPCRGFELEGVCSGVESDVAVRRPWLVLR